MQFVIAALSFLLSTAAWAADVGHEVDFTQVLSSLTGEAMTQCVKVDPDGRSCIEKAPLTLGDAAILALETLLPDERGTDAKTKFDRDVLARKVYKNAHAAMTLDETKMLKDRMGKVLDPAQLGAAWPLIDPTVKEAK